MVGEPFIISERKALIFCDYFNEIVKIIAGQIGYTTDNIVGRIAVVGASIATNRRGQMQGLS